MESSAVVVFSGGQDSTTCLALARERHEEVFAISFAYGQRHAVELASAHAICEKLDVPWRLIHLDFFAEMITSALTGAGDVGSPHAHKPGLPASYVPNRNALFLTLAHAHAQERGAKYLYTGACETDSSGYPDCRRDFIDALELALNLGSESAITICTPLMHLDKAQTFELANKLGILPLIITDTHTCYNGGHTEQLLHPWGYGCGNCPACQLRAKGYAEFLQHEDTGVAAW